MMSDSDQPSSDVEAKEKFPVTREELYQKVWSQPMTHTAKEYNVSGSYLTRVCKRLNVPRPEAGYWAKVAAGKVVNQLALPEAQPEHEPEWGGGEYVYKASYKAPSPKPPKNMQQTVSSNKKPLTTHSLIAGAKKLFLIGRESRTEYLRPNKRLLVDLVVSKPMLNKALNAANQLFLTFREYDHRVCIAPVSQHFHRHSLEESGMPCHVNKHETFWYPARPTVIFIGTVAIGLTFYEMNEEFETKYKDGKYIRAGKVKPKRNNQYSYNHNWTSTQNFPNGCLCLQAYSPYQGTSWARQWQIKQGCDFKKLGRKIAKDLVQDAVIIAGLAEEANRQAEIERLQWEEQRAEWKREEEERRKAKAFMDSNKELLNIIEKWNKAQRIEHFFREVEGSIQHAELNEGKLIIERLAKARELIGEVNALEDLKLWKTPEERLMD